MKCSKSLSHCISFLIPLFLIVILFQVVTGNLCFSQDDDKFDEVVKSHREFQEVNAVVKGRYCEITGLIKNTYVKKYILCTIYIKALDKKDNVVNSTKVTLKDIEPNESKAFYAIMLWPKSAKKYVMDVDKVKVDWQSSYGFTGEK